MRDELLDYYERELRFIRRSASEFAARYPAVAGRLLLEPEKCEDPHVERIIEAFAMLSARVHMRLDDDFPELNTALLGVLCPHYTAPVPSTTVVRFEADPAQGVPPEGLRIERRSLLYARPLDGIRCRFTTCYPVTLWPLEVTSAKVLSIERREPACPEGVAGAIRIGLRTRGGVPFSELPIDGLRFFLNGEASVIYPLHEIIHREGMGLRIRADRLTPLLLEPEAIRPVGFESDEGIIDWPLESFLGYRLLHEYFTFPDKFLFLDLAGLDRALPAVKKEDLEIDILLKRWPGELSERIEPENFALGCAPAVNLFPQQADPVSLKQTRVEYPLVPEVHAPHAFEVHAVTGITGSAPGRKGVKAYRPFYSLKHGDSTDAEPAFWHLVRRPSPRKNDPGTDTFLTLVDRDFKPAEPPDEVLYVTVLCSNRELPARLPFGDVRGDFQLEGHPEIRSIRCLRKPTPPLRHHLRDGTRWKLISHLSLNYLSIEELAGDGTEAGGKARPRRLPGDPEPLRFLELRRDP